jgi:hypothetical protein
MRVLNVSIDPTDDISGPPPILRFEIGKDIDDINNNFISIDISILDQNISYTHDPGRYTHIYKIMPSNWQINFYSNGQLNNAQQPDTLSIGNLTTGFHTYLNLDNGPEIVERIHALLQPYLTPVNTQVNTTRRNITRPGYDFNRRYKYPNSRKRLRNRSNNIMHPLGNNTGNNTVNARKRR